MKLKKFFAGVVAAAMMLTMGASVAFAEGNLATVNEHNQVIVKKVYTLDGNGKSPTETFNFTVAGVSVTDAGTGVNTTPTGMPTPTISTAAYNAGGATNGTPTGVDVTIDFEKDGKLIYNGVGKYTYTVKESAGNTLGVSYDAKEYTMKVTVVNGTNVGEYKIESVSFNYKDDKGTDHKDANPEFDNSYAANTLTVSKKVDGALGDKDYEFEFTVKFTNSTDKTWSNDITANVTKRGSETKTEVTKNSDGEYVFKLKHDDKIEFENVPAGLTYTVDEKAVDGYETTVNNGSKMTANEKGMMEYTGTASNEPQNVEYKNEKGPGTPDMGVILDNAPYIALMAIVVFGGVALMLNKRRRDEE